MKTGGKISDAPFDSAKVECSYGYSIFNQVILVLKIWRGLVLNHEHVLIKADVVWHIVVYITMIWKYYILHKTNTLLLIIYYQLIIYL